MLSRGDICVHNWQNARLQVRWTASQMQRKYETHDSTEDMELREEKATRGEAAEPELRSE